MSILDGVPSPNRIRIFDPVSDANILQKQEGGLGSVINQPVQDLFPVE